MVAAGVCDDRSDPQLVEAELLIDDELLLSWQPEKGSCLTFSTFTWVWRAVETCTFDLDGSTVECDCMDPNPAQKPRHKDIVVTRPASIVLRN